MRWRGSGLGAPHPQLARLAALPASQRQRLYAFCRRGGVVCRLHGADRRELAKAGRDLERGGEV